MSVGGSFQVGCAQSAGGTIPAAAGAGLKPEHLRDILASRPKVGFFEIHAENYMGAGGAPHAFMTRIRERFPLSLHGVGLSIGGAQPLDADHIARLRRIVDRYEPALFSEHLAWSTHDGMYFNDLLPIVYDVASLTLVVEHIDEVQETLGRRMLLENPSTYFAFDRSTFSEIDFLAEVARRSGCGLLLDINNVFVSATNNGWRALDYIDAFPVRCVEEIHLGGHAADEDDAAQPVLIDAHDRPVAPQVWSLYERALERRGRVPTLIEWDTDVPAWPILLGEVARVQERLDRRGANLLRDVAT